MHNIVIPCFQFIIPVVQHDQSSDTIEQELMEAQDELSSIQLEGSQAGMVQSAVHATSTPLRDGKLNT